MNSQKMTRKTSSCAICENSNLASICVGCVNYRLNEYNTNLKSLNGRRDSLYSRLSEVLVAKGKVDDQLSWRVLQNEKLARLREKLHFRKEQLSQGKAKVEKTAYDLKFKYELLESAMSTLERNRTEQLEKFYPNFICTQSPGHMAITSERLHKQSVVIKQICKLFPQRQVNIDGERKNGSSGQYDQICDARLPRGLDPHSVPSYELAASLGSSKQVQQLNKSVWNVNSTISSSALLDSAHTLPITRNTSDKNLPSSAASFLYATELSDTGKNENLIEEWDLVEHPKNENLIEEWDLVEHPTFLPPPS